jgi:hypothetical protein
MDHITEKIETKVTHKCDVLGEAAGLMAAMSDDFTTLEVGEVQEKLRMRGVKLHEREL